MSDFNTIYSPMRDMSTEQKKLYQDNSTAFLKPLDTQTGGDHYKKMKIQPVEFIHANNIPFIEGCVIKYISRWRSKNGIQDLEKAKHFIDLLIQLETQTKQTEK